MRWTTLWAGWRPWDEALAGYQEQRDSTTANCYLLTLSSAALTPLPECLERYFQAASSRPEEVTLILGVMGGAVPAHDVCNRAHVDAFIGGPTTA